MYLLNIIHVCSTSVSCSYEKGEIVRNDRLVLSIAQFRFSHRGSLHDYIGHIHIHQQAQLFNLVPVVLIENVRYIKVTKEYAMISREPKFQQKSPDFRAHRIRTITAVESKPKLKGREYLTISDFEDFSLGFKFLLIKNAFLFNLSGKVSSLTKPLTPTLISILQACSLFIRLAGNVFCSTQYFNRNIFLNVTIFGEYYIFLY